VGLGHLSLWPSLLNRQLHFGAHCRFRFKLIAHIAYSSVLRLACRESTSLRKLLPEAGGGGVGLSRYVAYFDPHDKRAAMPDSQEWLHP